MGLYAPWLHSLRLLLPSFSETPPGTKCSGGFHAFFVLLAALEPIYLLLCGCCASGKPARCDVSQTHGRGLATKADLPAPHAWLHVPLKTMPDSGMYRCLRGGLNTSGRAAAVPRNGPYARGELAGRCPAIPNNRRTASVPRLSRPSQSVTAVVATSVLGRAVSQSGKRLAAEGGLGVAGFGYAILCTLLHNTRDDAARCALVSDPSNNARLDLPRHLTMLKPTGSSAAPRRVP